MRQQLRPIRQEYHSLPTLVHGNTSDKGGLWIKYSNLRSINSEGNTVRWNVRVDGDQGVRARRNREDPIAGEVSHGKAGVLDPKIRVREGERCARSKVIVLCTECQHPQTTPCSWLERAQFNQN